MAPRHEPRGDEITVAASFGAQYELGTCTRVLRGHRPSPWPWAFMGLPVALGTIQILSVLRLVDPYPALAATPVGIALLALAIRRGWPPKMDRVFWYTGGLAQVIDGEPGPRVVRWDDVTSVTAGLHHTGESTGVALCTVSGDAGVEVTVSDGYEVGLSGVVLREATHVLSPRLVPPLIQRYDSGQPVVFGDTTVDRSGIRWRAEFTAWREMRRIDGYLRDARPEVKIRTASVLARPVQLPEEPNGIFVFDVIRHAAAQNGVPFRDVRPATPSAGWSAPRT